ncbi:hypothetical protein J2X04_002842 [Lysobacter niabensis]|uniref:PIN-like domain-containing protein n=1 Tax=Agrilutibacter niabensis TaxID=380628 RepID=A0ABU1VSJ8_9GAMM|nr:PIN domain-containing protein [Lysobacter niabensis]MDR7100461.1 hypothetical protein [Lysobacter niabensis]
MTKPYFLIDFENVQPKALGRLQPGTSRIKVFLGQNQNKMDVDLAKTMHSFGPDAEYIQIHGSGPNAVDFHIAFYIGRIAANEPGASFNIVSKDKGFDPLVRHLNDLGIGCRRLTEIPGTAAAAPAKKAAGVTRAPTKVPTKKAAKNITVTVLSESTPTPAAAKPVAAKQHVPQVVDLLKKSTKPATLSGLKSSIKSWIKPVLDDKTVASIVQSLQDSKKITVTGSKVAYALG